jgi:N-dimethylarginine dimethylaminohydrolase
MFYMSPPEYFQIEFMLNIWTDISARVNPEKAHAQWENLLAAYKRFGIPVQVIPPYERAPELPFVGDSIFLYRNKAVSSRFRFTERMPEVAHNREYFMKQGFEVCDLPPGVCYEGNGDSLIWNGKMLGGCGIRSHAAAYPVIADFFDIEVIPLELVQPFYHLDLALFPIDTNTLAYFPGAFTSESAARIESLAQRIIYLDDQEVMRFVANNKKVGDTILFNGNKYPKFEAAVKELGYYVMHINTSEFNKAGGGAKCMTLEHYQ